MQKKTGFIAYDWFKLIVAIFLGLALLILWTSLPVSKPTAEAPAAEMEEVPAVEATPTAEPVVVETAEADETPAEVELPPFPEPSAALEYDAANGGLVDAAGNLVYTLNADGSGWTPVIPEELADMQLDGEWELLDSDGNPAYTWDAASGSWVALEQAEEPVVEEEAPAATTHIVDCPGAAEPRLVGGQPAEVVRDVNFRSSPGVGDNWSGGFAAGDQVSVMGETVCTPYGNGAYLWWEVERADGTLGWIAEAAANSPKYFLAPVE